MREAYQSPKPLTFTELIEAVQNDQLHQLDLPDIAESPYDTSGEAWVTLPEDVHDVRECRDNDFTIWRPGDRIRGTFNLCVTRPHPSEEDQSPLVWAAAENLSFGEAESGWNNRLYYNAARFALREDARQQLPAATVAAISQLGRLQVIADITYNNAESANLTHIHALQQPYDGHPASIHRYHPTVVQGTISRFYVHEHCRSPQADPDAMQQAWFEIAVTDPQTQRTTPVMVAWDAAAHHYYTSSWRNNYAAYPVAQPMVGDQVQAVCYALSDDEEQPEFHSVYSGMHLLQPAEEQLDWLIQLEQDFAPLDTEVYDLAFRRHLGSLLAMYIEENGSLEQALPPAYVRRLEERIKAFNLFWQAKGLSDQRYIGLNIATEDARMLSSTYGQNILVANHEELGIMAISVSLGDTRPVKRVPAGYGQTFFNVLQAFNPAVSNLVSRMAISSLYDVAIKQDASAYAIRFNHDLELITAALSRLENTSERQDLALELLHFANKIFDPDTAHHPMRSQLREPTFEAVCTLLAQCIRWQKNSTTQSSRIEGIVDVHNYKAFRAGLPSLLSKMHNYYAADPDPKLSHRQAELDRLQLILQILDTHDSQAGLDNGPDATDRSS